MVRHVGVVGVLGIVHEPGVTETHWPPHAWIKKWVRSLGHSKGLHAFPMQWVRTDALDNGFSIGSPIISNAAATTNHHVESQVGVSVPSMPDVRARGGRGAAITVIIFGWKVLVALVPLPREHWSGWPE